MTINDYTTAALKFAEDSADWGGLASRAHYTTTSFGCWVETSDNAHSGLHIEWAFHETPEVIRAEAPQHYVDEIADLLEQAIDESWDAEQLDTILDLMR